MKILLIDFGGYAFIHSLAQELAKYNSVEYVFSSSSGGAKNDFKETGGLKVIDLILRKYDKVNFIERRKAEIEFGKKVSLILKTNKYDRVISTNVPIDALNLISQTASKLNYYHIVWVQDLISIAVKEILKAKYLFFGRIVAYYYKWLEKKSLRKANQILVTFEKFEDIIKEWGIRKKVSVFRNWAPVEKIKILEKNNNVSRRLNISEKFVILYSGSLGLKHDPRLIIDISEKLIEYDSIVLLIVSEGTGKNYLLKEKAEKGIKNIVLLDYQKEEDYNYILSASDVFLVLLDKNAQVYSVPSKVWTSMCAGIPIVSNLSVENQAGEVIFKKKTGFLSPNIQGMTEAILKLYKNPQIGIEYSSRARLYAEENFRIESLAKRFMKLISNI